MLRIYGAAKSRALRTLWMVGELGLEYDHKAYLPRAPETRTPEFRALNANGRVPVIDDDGFILSESMAINFYLAKKHKSALYPSDPKNEALALQWHEAEPETPRHCADREAAIGDAFGGGVGDIRFGQRDAGDNIEIGGRNVRRRQQGLEQRPRRSRVGGG